MREGFGVNSNSDINMIETDKKQGSVMTASCEDGFKYAINSRNNNQFPDTSSHANHPLISKIRPDDAQEERDAIENSRRDVRIQKTHRLTEVPSGQTEDLVSHEDGLGAIQKNSVFIHENGSNSTSWLARISSGIDHKGRSEQEKLHVVDDGILSSGPVAANSGVSFFISRCPLPSQPVDNSKRTDQNVNSAIVRPEPDCETCQIATPTYDTSYSEKQGMALTFECVSYTVHKRRNRVWKQGIRGKKILQGVTGAVGAGEMLALMGPSGSGKTTLLSLLGGRHMGREGVAKGSAKGLILYDGASYSKTLNARMGFVTQDDLLYTHLTVEETLKYAALLRLPADMTRTQKADRVDEIIQQLGLERCRNTIIGSAFVRGISGGERKRVCIGHEIIINPSLLFLDEPTSGLDSTTALRIMFLLQRLAKVRGITIVTSVHQPSSRAFYLFDMLLLLAEGRCVYFGKARSAMQCFETWGFAPLMPMNPADFLLDVCSGNTFDMKVPPTLESAEHHETKDPVRIHKMSDGPSFNIEEIVQYLVDCRAKERSMDDNKEAAGSLIAPTMQILNREGKSTKGRQQTDFGLLRPQMRREWATNWTTQVYILLERGLKERRDEYLGWLKVTQVMATALLCGALWWRSSSNSTTALKDQAGLLFFIGLFWGFFPLFNAIFTFPLERALLAKERSSDMYRLSAYFIARFASDLPLDLLLPTCFVSLVYFMATLRMSVISFVCTMLAVYLTVTTSQGVGLLIGAALMDVKKATTFGSVLVIALMLAAGFFIQHIPPWVVWLQYFSFQSYCYKLLLKIQYYPNYSTSICISKGEESFECKEAYFLRESLHGTPLTPDPMDEVWPLLAISIASRFLAYLLLRNLTLGNVFDKMKKYCASKFLVTHPSTRKQDT